MNIRYLHWWFPLTRYKHHAVTTFRHGWMQGRQLLGLARPAFLGRLSRKQLAEVCVGGLCDACNMLALASGERLPLHIFLPFYAL